MPYMTFIMLKANYPWENRSRRVRHTETSGAFCAFGRERAHLGPRPMNESLVRCSYEEIRPVD